MKKSFLAAAILVTLGLSVIRANSTPTIQKMSPTPICFTENKGQWHEDVKFRCDAGGAIVWICKDRVVYQFLRRVGAPPLAVGTDSQSFFPNDPLDRFNQEPDSIEQLVITARFVDANPNAKVSGDAMMEYKCNYFIGNDPNKWHTDVPNYEAVTLADVYDGVDLQLFAGENGSLMYRYDIAPSAYQERVKVEYEGLEQSTFDDNGRMVTQTRWGEISGLLSSPSSTAEFSGLQSEAPQPNREINSSAFRSPGAVRLLYSTYLGGSSWDRSYGVAVDKMGNAYVTGLTRSADFPLQSPYDGSFGGQWDVYVSKMSASGNELLYSTFLGGISDEWSMAIAVGSSGNAYITGRANNSDFPLQNPYDGSYNGRTDVFISVLSPSGNSLLFSTFLGGSGYDEGRGIAVDSLGNAFVTGWTQSTDFPVQNPYDGSFNGGSYDVFVSKISPTGSNLDYSTLLGGNDIDCGNGIAVDTSGNAYVVGRTWSTNFPVQNSYDGIFNGGEYDAFVSKLSSSGEELHYSTYLGGTGDDWISKIAVDISGSAYVTGGTSSPDFPLQYPYDTSTNGGLDVFVTHLSPSGGLLIYSTYIGGSNNDEGFGIVVDRFGNAFVTGYTTSLDFPIKNSYSWFPNGIGEVIICKLIASGSALYYSAVLGGYEVEIGYGIAIDAIGNAYVTGYTFSSDFPMQDPYDGIFDGDEWDVFLSKLEFSCGDSNADSVTNISDAVLLIRYILTDGPAPYPFLSGDTDCSGGITFSDVIVLINHVFNGGPAPCAACP